MGSGTSTGNSSHKMDMEEMSDESRIAKICQRCEEGIVSLDFVRENGSKNKERWRHWKSDMKDLLTSSDEKDEAKIEIGKSPSLFEAIVKLFKDWQQDHMDRKLEKYKDKCLSFCLNLCHKVAAIEGNVRMMRVKKVTEAAFLYMKSPSKDISLFSVITLARLVNEEEAGQLKLKENHGILRDVLSKLQTSIGAKGNKKDEWTAEALTKAIRELTRIDALKRILVEIGFLTAFVELLQKGNEKEQEEAIKCLWALSFEQENKMPMVKFDGLISCLEKKYNTTQEKSVKDACYGIFWSLRYEIKSPECPVVVGNAIRAISSKESTKSSVGSDTSTVRGHVMLSYSWSDQKIIKRIADELKKEGIPIWLDIYDLEGSILDAMARAVEESSIVIIAMSQKYKDSSNTRKEADYAFTLRKKVIPLMMHEGYIPDGWLGMLIGSLKYYSFWDGERFESQMKELTNAILRYIRSPSTMAGTSLSNSSAIDSGWVNDVKTWTEGGRKKMVEKTQLVTSAIDSGCFNDTKTWTEDGRKKWLKKHSLSHNIKLSGLSGEDVVFLHMLFTRAPEYFLHYLETKFGFTSISDLAKVTSAFSDLHIY